ncbi:MAG TPA: hypothetical protein VKH63_16555 [Candidatus Acidoferrum sp.]|jgi:hypothetical protein|nr:hypothetical protein [Candidatus Acidoferrum sp.]
MSTAAAAQNPRANSTTLGALWIVYAILRLVAAILLVLYAGTATVMFGALLTRVADYATPMTIFHIFYIAAIIVTALSGIFGLLAGLALLAGKSARTLSLVAAFLSLSDLPLGTTLGIYTLIVFLP